MLQVHSAHRIDQIELALGSAAKHRGGSVLAVSHVGQLLNPGRQAEECGAVAFTVCFADLYATLLNSDIRFAAFLPSRIAVYPKGQGTLMETMSPRDYCRALHRTDLEALAAPLEEALRGVMEEAAQPHQHSAAEHLSTEDQVNMRLTLPQRIDCRGSKIEEMAGTGAIDTQGG